LASARRLRVLRAVIAAGEVNVSGVAALCRLPMPSATLALRALQARGLLHARRQGKRVLYAAIPDPLVVHSSPLLDHVRHALDSGTRAADVVRSMTAFTHVRRMFIARALSDGPLTVTALSARCAISPQALYRHVAKLQRRGLVEPAAHGTWRLATPSSALLRGLLHLVLSD
jgi:DNA-binding transcriptional ArsR family regulator